MSNRTKGDEKKIGYHGFRYLLLDGQVQRRLCTVFGDKAFVHGKNPRQRGLERALVVKAARLFKTEADASGGNDVDLFLVHGAEYEKIRARLVESSGLYYSVSNGELHRIYGTFFNDEKSALDYCIEVAARESKRAHGNLRKLWARRKQLNARKTASKARASRARR